MFFAAIISSLAPPHSRIDTNRIQMYNYHIKPTNDRRDVLCPESEEDREVTADTEDPEVTEDSEDPEEVRDSEDRAADREASEDRLWEADRAIGVTDRRRHRRGDTTADITEDRDASDAARSRSVRSRSPQ